MADGQSDELAQQLGSTPEELERTKQSLTKDQAHEMILGEIDRRMGQQEKGGQHQRW